MIGWTLPTYSSVFRDEAPESPIPWLNAGFLLERPGGLKVLGHGNQQKWNGLRPYRLPNIFYHVLNHGNQRRMTPTRRVEHPVATLPECSTGLAGRRVQRTGKLSTFR
jgi:hypothetical protein